MSSVLVVRLSSLGDIVLTQPVLAGIQAAGHAVDLLVKPDYAGLAGLLPGATRVLTSRSQLAPAYDLILDLHGTVSARRAVAAATAGRRLRYAKHSLARRLLVRPGGHPVFWNRWSPLRHPQSVLDWYLAAARRAGFSDFPPRPRVVPPAPARPRLGAWGVPDTGRYVLMAPGAKWPTKQWPPEHYAQLASRVIREMNRAVVLVGGEGERDVCRQVAELTGGQAASAAGATDLPTLAGWLRHADLLVANDSGPLHLGLAAGTRVLAFFGPTVPEFGFAPFGDERARILSRPMPCRPCSLHGGRRCPLGHHDCLRRLDPAEALAALREMLP